MNNENYVSYALSRTARLSERHRQLPFAFSALSNISENLEIFSLSKISLDETRTLFLRQSLSTKLVSKRISEAQLKGRAGFTLSAGLSNRSEVRFFCPYT